MNKKIKIGLFALIILGTITLCLTYKSNDKIIKTKKRKQNNLAIMIKEDGATDYTKSNSKDIPKGDYVLNRDKSYCKNNGKIGNYDSSLGKVSFSFIGTDSCYLYFDYKEDTSLYGTIKKRAKADTTYLALYTGEGADTYANPVYYYKGNVQNNNVLFGGFCWKIVRTTETGGVKIVYNGVQKDEYEKINENEYTVVSNDETYPYTFDSTSKTWVSTNKTNNATGTITFTVATAGNYYLSYAVSSEENFDIAKFYKNGNPLGDSNGYSGTQSGTIALTGLTTSDVIKVEYTKDSSGARGSDTVTFSIGKAIGDPVKSCNNTGTDSQIGTSKFNNDLDSPAYVGYMHNTVYPVASKSMSSQSNIVFGNSFDYNSNNGTYTLKDTKTVATWSSGYNTINNNHYTCMTTGTTCSSIYYVFYTSSSTAYYITLTNGKTVNDVLNEMLYADDVNKNDSTIKNYIDKWYINNLKSYEDKLEDTIFCNDRGILNLNGWDPNGGDTTQALHFKNYGASNKSLVCTNETDRFSISNPKAKLKHPIGLLSLPELSLAGYGSSHYFNNGQWVWLASPNKFNSNYADGRMASLEGLSFGSLDSSEGVRPSVSLKPKTYFSSGDGSFTNPFVIGDAVEKPSGKSFDTVFAANDTDIFNENGLRYEGEDPYNYICLDNKTSGGCSDSSLLFRIIGLFDEDTSSDGTSSSGTKKLLKVIDTNNYGGKDGKYWNSAGTNNWSTASLKTELNGTYLTTLLGTSNVNSKLNTAIVTSKWHLGGASPSNCQTITAEGIYTEERNTSAIYSGNPASIYAKVGLMYPSDYGYATVGGTTNKSRCREKELYNWDNSSYSDCKNNDWLYKSQSSFVNNREWFLSPYSSVSNYAAGLFSSGFVYLDGGSGVGSSKAAVRPTFYLDSSILKIVGTGDGSSSNPYRIG